MVPMAAVVDADPVDVSAAAAVSLYTPALAYLGDISNMTNASHPAFCIRFRRAGARKRCAFTDPPAYLPNQS